MADSDNDYVDDETIADSDPIWRRIPPRHFVFDENKGMMRPSSAAFEDHPDGSPMSVVLGKMASEAGRTPETVLEGHEGYGLVAFPASVARAKGQKIVKKWLQEEPAHAEVFGKKTKGVRKAIAKASDWIIEPPATN